MFTLVVGTESQVHEAVATGKDDRPERETDLLHAVVLQNQVTTLVMFTFVVEIESKVIWRPWQQERMTDLSTRLTFCRLSCFRILSKRWRYLSLCMRIRCSHRYPYAVHIVNSVEP